MPVSRRDFLLRVGAAGGYNAAFLALNSLALTAPATPLAPLPPSAGQGARVAILGGGIAGLVAAYEARAAGFDPVVLEARPRPGGRNWTVRGGDAIELAGMPTQTCAFDAGHYQNVGPARLPSIHTNILGYCRKLGVPLEVEINTTRSSHIQNDRVNGGAPFVQRQVVNDTRGHVSELLLKSMSSGALDADFSAEDRERMLAFLRVYGPLDEAGKYTGSDRAGYKKPAGAGDDSGVLAEPIDMRTLLAAEFWQGILFEEAFDMQATMFQPVGGMDRIPYAFAKALGPVVQYDAPVTEIRRTATGVRIGYTQKGAPKQIEAAYCICALPLTMLKGIPNDFSAPYKKVIDEATYAHAYKIAWESRRFWEEDDNIYGGLEFVSQGPSPVWFPSGGLFSPRGVLVSGYTEERMQDFDKLSLDEKLAASRASIEKLHPGRGKELEKPIYVGWGQVAHNQGSWIMTYGPGEGRAQDRFRAPLTSSPKSQAPGAGVSKQGAPTRPAAAATETNRGYETLIAPDGPFHFAGDHCSHIVGWQEGAALSSLRALRMIADHAQAART